MHIELSACVDQCVVSFCLLLHGIIAHLHVQELQRVAELQLSLQNTVSVCVNGRRYIHMYVYMQIINIYALPRDYIYA